MVELYKPKTTEDRLFSDQISYYMWLFHVVKYDSTQESTKVISESINRNHKELLIDYNR